VPDLLTQVREKENREKDAGMRFQHVGEISVPFYLGQGDVQVQTCKSPAKKKSAEFLVLDEGILR